MILKVIFTYLTIFLCSAISSTETKSKSTENSTLNLQNEEIMPPTSGKFFYADLETSETFGNLILNVLVGEQKKQMTIKITTNQYNAAIVTTQCSDSLCNNKNKWDLSGSLTASIVNSTSVTWR